MIKRSLWKHLITVSLLKNSWSLARKRVGYLNKRNNNHKFINEFNPDISVFNTDCRDYLLSFNAGEGYENFNDFLISEAEEYCVSGEGVTYIIWNYRNESDSNEKEVVAYFTLSANAIPYIDRIRLDEKEALELGKEFDEENWGITVIEIKMFAVNDKYQDLFYIYDGDELPVSAWCLRAIVNYTNELNESVLAFKALFLHSVPDAEEFYLKNGFQDMKVNMYPFCSIDSDMKPMWMPLKNIYMNYDK